jgi:hypothetical protein
LDSDNEAEMPIPVLGMNIKGLINFPTSEIRPIEKVDRTIKSEEAQDRDANGQDFSRHGEQQQHREPMNEEQLNRALDHLKNLPGVKEHHWTIELEVADNGRFFLVKDNLGTLIRRIPELDLWTLETDIQPTGHHLKKTA